jgi:hypothetical protein
MNHFWRLLTLLFLVSIPTYYVPLVIMQDLSHPELWEQDWMHDPRIYLPMLAGVVVMGLLMAMHVYWTERRKR